MQRKRIVKPTEWARGGLVAWGLLCWGTVAAAQPAPETEPASEPAAEPEEDEPPQAPADEQPEVVSDEPGPDPDQAEGTADEEPSESVAELSEPPPTAPTEEEASTVAPNEAPKAEATTADTAAEATAADAELPDDRLSHPGYVPGYRRYPRLGLAPYTPRGPGRPGIAPGFEAAIPPDQWTFRFSGFMKASLQVSLDERYHTQEGQHETLFHVPPQTVEEYASFLSTSTVPGNWVTLIFNYGTSRVNATVTIDTWNPAAPATYYQLGSHYQFNNAFLTYATPQIDVLRFTVKAGYFVENYGGLGEYGNGMYQAPIIGAVRGVGAKVTTETELSDEVVAALDVGVMGSRDGKAADGVIRGAGQSFGADPTRPASWIHLAQLGVVKKGDPELHVQAHYLKNWSREDRTKLERDILFTRQIDESKAPDRHITVYGFSATLKDSVYGFFGAAVAFIQAEYAYPLRGLITFGGDGEQLTDRWLGASSFGTGTMWLGAVNYQVSLGKIVAHPTPFWGDGPDIKIQTGFQIAGTTTDFERYDGRVRHKYGIDGLYTFLPWMGVGLRTDRVVPNSKDPEETFHVVAPRLQFKSDWNSRETIELIYGKWFYGTRTRNEGTGERSPERLDDQMFALSFNMWW